ncbi:MAG: hypothetical protein ACRDD8_16065 [Bacteroidales bacterium]
MNNLYNIVIGSARRKSPRYLQIDSEIGEELSAGGFDTTQINEDRILKLLSLLYEEILLTNNFMASDVFDDLEYWIQKQKPINPSYFDGKVKKIENREKKVEKIEEKVIEVVETVSTNRDVVNLVTALGYSNGSGITRMVNLTKDDSLLLYKPYSAMREDEVYRLLTAVLPHAPAPKAAIIKRILEEIDARER